MLSSEEWYFITDVSGLHIGPIGCPETSVTTALCNISEERRSHLHGGGSLIFTDAVAKQRNVYADTHFQPFFVPRKERLTSVRLPVTQHQRLHSPSGFLLFSTSVRYKRSSSLSVILHVPAWTNL